MNGKGSARRPSSVNRETYEENWEMIFRKKKKSKKTKKKRSKKDEEKDVD
jgi:glycine cleavage system H lipoate-binding protein